MGYSSSLAERIRDQVLSFSGIQEKKMFGGIGFMWNNHMTFAVFDQWLILRIGVDHEWKALARPFVKAFDLTGRPMKGWVMVAPGGVETDESLRDWLQLALSFVATLPQK